MLPGLGFGIWTENIAREEGILVMKNIRIGLCGVYVLSSCLTWRQQRRPRASPGTGRGDGAHREPLVKAGSAPGARQGGANPGGIDSRVGRDQGT